MRGVEDELAQRRRTMKMGAVTIWVDTSQRFHSFGEEGGGCWEWGLGLLGDGWWVKWGSWVVISRLELGLSGGRMAIAEDWERERACPGLRSPGSGSSVSGMSSSSFSDSTTGSVIVSRKTLGAATMPSSFSHMFLSFQEYRVGKRVDARTCGDGSTL